MVGTIPPTALLLTKNDFVIVEFRSYFEVTKEIGISVSDEGVVTFLGKELHPHYVMKDNGQPGTKPFTSKQEVIRGWAGEYMRKHMHEHGYFVYRFLKN